MLNSAFYSWPNNRWPSAVDYQNQHTQNSDCSDFDSLDVDGSDIDDHLFWAVNVWIVSSWIMPDKKVEYYEKNRKQFSKLLILKRNHEFFSKLCLFRWNLDFCWNWASNNMKNFENLLCIFFLTFELTFKMVVVQILMVNCW